MFRLLQRNGVYVAQKKCLLLWRNVSEYTYDFGRGLKMMDEAIRKEKIRKNKKPWKVIKTYKM